MPVFRTDHPFAAAGTLWRRTVRLRLLFDVAIFSTVVIGGPMDAHAKAFYAREEIPSLAFPHADTVEPHDYILTSAQRDAIEKQARAKLDSSIMTVYTGRKEGIVLGYAFLDTRIVRTLPETLLIVLTPDGSVSATYVLAFYEPLEYQPSDRWLEQLKGRKLSDHLKIGDELAAITGSTLSSNAVVDGIRRALSAYHVLIACDSSSPESGHVTDCSR